MSQPVYPHPILAKEGWPFIAISFVLSIVATIFCPWLSIVLWIITVFVVQFFRDPARQLPTDNDRAILSPADGRIVVVEKVQDPFRQCEALKISVFMNVFNVHSNRSPINGTVEKIEYFSGSFLNAAVDKASEQNERNAVLAQTKQGDKITFVQIAGLVARRILCYVKVGDKLYFGKRYGFIRFGSRVDIYLPPQSKANVVIGDKVRATETILAYLPDMMISNTTENQ